jgi:hypothetical protein
MVKKLHAMVDSLIGEIKKTEEQGSSNYSVLSAQHIVEGKRWNLEWTLSEYIKQTDGLIGKMDGTIPLKGARVYKAEKDGLTEERRDLLPPDSIIYLDKSSRPVEWAVRELWSTLARTPGTEYVDWSIPKRPDSHFLNIDKIDWLKRMGIPSEHLEDAPLSMVNIAKLDKEHLARIRALYSTAKISEGNVNDAWNHPTIFGDKHIMVVDEVESSGHTLRLAQMMLSAAMPEATFSGQYWLRPRKVPLNNGVPDPKDGKVQFRMAWVPVWYSSDISAGRGVSDARLDWPEIASKQGHHVSRYAGIGRYVLSTPSHDYDSLQKGQDMRAQRLRQDFKKLGEDLLHHKVLYRPSTEREEENMVERVEQINGMSIDEWKKKRDAVQP